MGWARRRDAARRQPANCLARRSRPDGAAIGRAVADDAGEKQQSNLPRSQLGGADGEEPRHRNSQSIGSIQPHGGSHCSWRTRLEIAADTEIVGCAATRTVNGGLARVAYG